MIDDDKYLIEEIQKGNENAYLKLYKRYWQRLYYTCYSRVRSKEETEDILQELFVEIWKRREKLLIRSSVEAYLFTALKYKIFKFIDTRNKKNNLIVRVENEELFGSKEETEDKLLFDELYSLIERNIEKLPKKCKMIFKLSRRDYLTASEISSKLNISQNTVENQITKAKKTIRLELQKVFTLIFFN